ncbi:MAG: hypothetical protein HYR70_04145 [Chloroflexi bacterium]|nr:hypothetical protein [Chloroflexota bacterium]MBI3340747.1 hypothetical protein [Chloroflexota bacterium]
MTNNNSITNELTGSANNGIETDHGGLGFGDLVVLLLDAVLLIYTAWRSYDFLTTTVPDGFQMLALVGLWGLDIGAVAWSLVWIFGSSAQYQDWTSMAFFIIDLMGVILTSITDSLMYGQKGGALTGILAGVAVVAIPLIVVFNVVAGFIYHMTSPETKARRAARKSSAEHKRKMGEIAEMERDLIYAEQYLLAKQETLDKATILAEIKTAQDAVEKATRAKLRDQLGIQQNANTLKANDAGSDKLATLKSHLADLRNKLDIASASVTPVPQAESDTATTPDLALIESGAPSPEAIKGNGHGKTDPI